MGNQMQREMTARVPLLGKKGELLHPGYARHMLYDYDRTLVAGLPFRLKEWDFYQFLLEDWVLQMTIGHVSYCTQLSAHLFSLENGEHYDFERMYPFLKKDLHFSTNPEEPGVLEARGQGFRMRYETKRDHKRLRLRVKGEEAVEIDLYLPWNPEEEKMVIATPFAKKGQFYLNCKEHYYGVKGTVCFGSRLVEADGRQTGLMDWGRGVWPFSQEWFWGCGADYQAGGRFGFNIGWGFGDTSRATENMFFWEGKAYKLGSLQVDRNPDDYMAPWRFYTQDGQFDLTMEPVHDHYTETKVLFVDNCCHQVHGKFSGKAVLPDGKVIEVTNMLAFCEHARDNW